MGAMGAPAERRPTLSVVVPVYNEQDVLPALLADLLPVLERSGCTWELLLIDDGSRDRTWSQVVAARAADSRITGVQLSRNFGHQLAITAGLEHARGNAVVVMDADLQDPPEVVLQLVEQWQQGFDIVHAVRTERQAESVFKRASAAVFYRVLNLLSPIPIHLDTGDFRLMSRRAVDALGQMPERARFVRGMVSWLGFRQTEVHFERAPRFAGRTKYPLRKMVAFASDGLISFSTVPLRLATSLGFTMALIAVLYLAYAVTMKLAYGQTVQGWASLVAVIVFIGSAQLICLGIIGEYVGRVYDEVKARPLYLVSALEQGDQSREKNGPRIRESTFR